jgi:hypothetical protein
MQRELKPSSALVEGERRRVMPCLNDASEAKSTERRLALTGSSELIVQRAARHQIPSTR